MRAPQPTGNHMVIVRAKQCVFMRSPSFMVGHNSERTKKYPAERSYQYTHGQGENLTRKKLIDSAEIRHATDAAIQRQIGPQEGTGPETIQRVPRGITAANETLHRMQLFSKSPTCEQRFSPLNQFRHRSAVQQLRQQFNSSVRQHPLAGVPADKTKFGQPMESFVADAIDGVEIGTDDDEGLAEFGLGRLHGCSLQGGQEIIWIIQQMSRAMIFLAVSMSATKSPPQPPDADRDEICQLPTAGNRF
jgi:hypothetical protein